VENRPCAPVTSCLTRASWGVVRPRESDWKKCRTRVIVQGRRATKRTYLARRRAQFHQVLHQTPKALLVRLGELDLQGKLAFLPHRALRGGQWANQCRRTNFDGWTRKATNFSVLKPKASAFYFQSMPVSDAAYNQACLSTNSSSYQSPMPFFFVVFPGPRETTPAASFDNATTRQAPRAAARPVSPLTATPPGVTHLPAGLPRPLSWRS
jgi:hypothetical protein